MKPELNYCLQSSQPLYAVMAMNPNHMFNYRFSKVHFIIMFLHRRVFRVYFSKFSELYSVLSSSIRVFLPPCLLTA